MDAGSSDNFHISTFSNVTDSNADSGTGISDVQTEQDVSVGLE